MERQRRWMVPGFALLGLSASACRGHTMPICGSSITSVVLPGAGDLAGAIFSPSDKCGAGASGTNSAGDGFVDVQRNVPGTCQVQVVLANGATYSFSVQFGPTGTGRCAGALGVIGASTPVLIDPGRCVPGDAGTADTGGGAATDGNTTADGGATADGGTTIRGPACANLTTAAGVAPMKACGCAATDPQLCYQPCGPDRQGVRAEQCTNGLYVETPLCGFDPNRDYSCYRVPAAAESTSCPAAGAPGEYLPPRESSACTVDRCSVCNSYGGLAGGVYVDARGATQVGYCVCTPSDSTGARSWNCAGDQDWPCPNGAGC